ncbi:hypothetical protein [Nostoc sp.]|uniref:hypothetical protein n=1 Tax=Nostoc sp. TaxID=1180 RepID=UPI002FF5E35C
MDTVMPMKDDIQLLCSCALVINGHGSKTVNDSIDIKNHILLTPHSLEVPYALSMDFSIESQLRQGFLPRVHNGAWTRYGLRYGTSHAPNVIIQPWSDGELLSFSRQIGNDPKLWSNIDGLSGYYCERDTSMCLILRTPDGTLSYIGRRMSAKCFEEISTNCQLTGIFKGYVPIFLYAPQVAKVKILGRTTLNEIMNSVQRIAGNRLLLLATCNTGQNNQHVSLIRDWLPIHRAVSLG